MNLQPRVTAPVPASPAVPPQQLRVLHAIGSVSLARGGPSVALFDTIAALRECGIESEIVTTDDDGAGQRMTGVQTGRPILYRDVVTHFFPRQTEFYSASWPMLGWLRRNAAHYDIAHIHALFNFAPGAAAATAAATGIPYVVRPAGVLGTWGREHRRGWLKQGSLRCIEGPLLRRAAAVQFTSETERLEAQGLPLPSRQAVIPLAVSLATADGEVRFNDDGGLGLAGKLHQVPWLLFLSRLDPKKGVERLLQAFALTRRVHPAAQLVIAGSGATRYEKELRDRCSLLGLDDCVHWTGFVDGQRKRWLLSHCTAFVLPSSSENFGIAAVEAMAAGRPVVVSEGVAVSEIVARWNAGAVTGLDPAAIAVALVATLAEPAAAELRGRRGREAVATELSPAAHGSRLASLYGDILAERRARKS